MNLMSKMPIKVDQIMPEELDLEILRAAMIAELDAVSFYEQLAVMAENPNVKVVLLDIAGKRKPMWASSRPCSWSWMKNRSTNL